MPEQVAPAGQGFTPSVIVPVSPAGGVDSDNLVRVAHAHIRLGAIPHQRQVGRIGQGRSRSLRRGDRRHRRDPGQLSRRRPVPHAYRAVGVQNPHMVDLRIGRGVVEIRVLRNVDPAPQNRPRHEVPKVTVSPPPPSVRR